MKKLKVIAGLIGVAICAAALIGLALLMQKLLISGTGVLNEMGGLLLDDEDRALVTPTPAPDLDSIFSADSFDGAPSEPSEPAEELISIPVDKTAEELAGEVVRE